MNDIIILLGQRVRSGTNFVGSTLAMHPNVVTLPSHVSLGEFNLFKDRSIIDTTFDAVSRMSFGMGITEDDHDVFLEHYGKLWLNFIINKYKVQEGKTIFVKSYVIENIDLWRRSFPNSKIAIICRDGRDNVISSVRASNDYRNWHSMVLKLKKRINYASGRSFINHSKHWVKTAKTVLDLKENDYLKVFKYEALNNSYKGIEYRNSIAILQFRN